MVGEPGWKTTAVGSSEGNVTSRHPGLRPRPPLGFAERNTTISIPKREGRGEAGTGVGVEGEAEAALCHCWGVCGANPRHLQTPELLVFHTLICFNKCQGERITVVPAPRPGHRMRPQPVAAMCCLLRRFPFQPPVLEAKPVQPWGTPPGPPAVPIPPPAPCPRWMGPRSSREGAPSPAGGFEAAQSKSPP